MKLIKYLSYIICFLVACTNNVEKQIETINLEEAYENPKEIFLSNIATSVEYIPLETKANCVIGRFPTFFSNHQYIIAITFRQVYLFDRATGKFVREIGRYGEGPGGYIRTIPLFNEEKQTIFCLGDNSQYEYNLDGKLIRTISPPKGIGNFSKCIPIDQHGFVSYKKNQTGNEKDRLLIHDATGNVLHKISNHNSFEYKKGRSSYSGEIFYLYHHQVYFFENCVDTIFSIQDNKLSPQYHLNLGKYRPPYDQKQELPWPVEKPLIYNYFDIRILNESNRFVFFDFYHKHVPENTMHIYHHAGYYDKIQKQTYISNAENEVRRSYLTNDIDMFIPIYPVHWTVNNNEEYTVSIEAGDIVEWFEENQDKVKKLPENLQKLSKLTSEDNPVVVIAKLKQ